MDNALCGGYLHKDGLIMVTISPRPIDLNGMYGTYSMHMQRDNRQNKKYIYKFILAQRRPFYIFLTHTHQH